MHGAQFTDDSMVEFISDIEQDDESDLKAYAKLKPGEIGDLCQPRFPKLASRAKPGRNEKAADVYTKIDDFYSLPKSSRGPSPMTRIRTKMANVQLYRPSDCRQKSQETKLTGAYITNHAMQSNSLKGVGTAYLLIFIMKYCDHTCM